MFFQYLFFSVSLRVRSGLVEQKEYKVNQSFGWKTNGKSERGGENFGGGCEEEWREERQSVKRIVTLVTEGREINLTYH